MSGDKTAFLLQVLMSGAISAIIGYLIGRLVQKYEEEE